VYDSVPSVFQGLRYFFDPTDILKVRFFRPYTHEDETYLYLLTLDLGFRSLENNVIEWGDNDTTPLYKTKNLFLESLLVPVLGSESGSVEEGHVKKFPVRQTLSETWIGETGSGYWAKGIWMDDDLTKFFSKLILPPGKSTYPFYPLVCRYKTVCQSLIDLSDSGRHVRLYLLHEALRFLGPHMAAVQESLKGRRFSKDIPVFKRLQREIPSDWRDVYDDVNIQSYLNAGGMREFAVERRGT
jgi:hypothetical protein